MKKEYDLKKLRRRPGTPKFDPEAAKIPISIRLDGSVLAALKTEAERLGGKLPIEFSALLSISISP